MAETEGAPPATVRGADDDGAARTATVTVAGVRHDLVAGRSFVFGRAESCGACLDPADVGISRRAGSIDCIDRTWFVTNRSSSRPLSAVDPLGFRSVLAPGRRMAVDGRLSIVVEGQIRRHELVITAPAVGERDPDAAATVPDGDGEGLPTEMGGGVTYNDKDRQALVALFAGYLQPFPRYDPTPRSYADAARALGWPQSTLRKRVEHLRSRVSDAGVPNLHGERAMEALAEHVIATGIITSDDLDLLP